MSGPWLVSASVVLPHGHPWVSDDLIDSYRRLGQLHVAALGELGVPARALPPQALPRSDDPSGVGAMAWACFGSLSPWELVNTEGRKLVGLAQRKKQTGVLLVAGTLIGAANWSFLCDVMGRPDDESMLRRRTVSAEEIAGRQIEPERFASALLRRLDRAFSTNSADRAPDENNALAATPLLPLCEPRPHDPNSRVRTKRQDGQQDCADCGGCEKNEVTQ